MGITFSQKHGTLTTPSQQRTQSTSTEQAATVISCSLFISPDRLESFKIIVDTGMRNRSHVSVKDEIKASPETIP